LASKPIRPPQRYGTAASVIAVQLRFNLPAHEVYSQDWELCCGDPERLNEFLTCYETEKLTEDERFTLMEIIISSFDEWLGRPDPNDFSNRLSRQLSRDYQLHAHTIFYWCVWHEDTDLNPDYQFAATPFLRSVWRSSESQRYDTEAPET
jgi:hypothetical protein